MLAVKNLDVVYNKVHLVQNLSFDIRGGECVCILGPSGSGKSISTKAMMGLLSPDFFVDGDVCLYSKSLLEHRELGKDITMIAQNPLTAFDNMTRIGPQIIETILAIEKLPAADVKQKAIDLLERLQMPHDTMKMYPLELTASLLQQIMVKLAQMMEPAVLVADCPTSAANDATRDTIVKDLLGMKTKSTSIVLITQDLSVAQALADKVVVMNNGSVVDCGTFDKIISTSQLDYAKYSNRAANIAVKTA
ncbi:MAG: hypothetical protein ATN34_01040 [Epulopiscium sp. Nele67-Bin002]|nr:MAG: hypothetical protein BEN18_08300 [Epulopiscium sp. Nuni2H_MBin001]OON92010.1 MAG: hypothetical protein ATN34_01040 [Epulopiscium sp. Nele67-Bin002]OON93766.1 MAG: hypothetical protein ATN33_05315 [Epulopiscium sp. Nele67-Bin001]